MPKKRRRPTPAEAAPPSSDEPLAHFRVRGVTVQVVRTILVKQLSPLNPGLFVSQLPDNYTCLWLFLPHDPNAQLPDGWPSTLWAHLPRLDPILDNTGKDLAALKGQATSNPDAAALCRRDNPFLHYETVIGWHRESGITPMD